MRVALVHDWLTGMRGGEKCLEVLCEMFPEAPVYTLVHDEGSVSAAITSHEIRTSFIQRIPGGVKHYRKFLPLFPQAIERFDLRGHDLVVSTSHCVAKGVVVHPGTRHLCYCHTPMRYVWSAYEEYFGGPRARTATGLAMMLLAPWLRAWDVAANSRVDHFVANSRTVAERIARYYGRDAAVVHPWVDTEIFVPGGASQKPEDAPYLMVTALVPYKRVEVAIRAAVLAGRELIVVGDGPERRRLERLHGGSVRFAGWLETPDLVRHYQTCRGLLFPGEEDFGIVPLEAMSCGRPVVALRSGGATETVVDGETGVFFTDPEPEAMAGAMARLETGTWDPEAIRRRALDFSRDRYREGMRREIGRMLEDVPVAGEGQASRPAGGVAAEAAADPSGEGAGSAPNDQRTTSWATLKGESGRPGSSSSGT
jgi:glycosyltransferase involved in cell wall biosynthesis